ncbi:MAG: hypothetical protein A3B90_01505 [Candidatus Magasanikbacteria bacterium RIFCSPHIGHO2_02_FULL_41_13]|uniref:Uncharacterized protein n=1 Tax=Candidatus Magasanikbacteria bacterium RIFCSPHIGHO2_02_FULL_41_13 TaxID=1798676 RepID=A0A1F6M4M8_9BACT|nr:MAG: hypothetical protein A3B90_01505 [Candidatus Magasanikbacteria bacterium RIFCSPHIGHO2_02_FULL_41_13]
MKNFEHRSILTPKDGPFKRLYKAQAEGFENRKNLQTLGKELGNAAIFAGWFDVAEKVARLNPDAQFIGKLEDRLRNVQVDMFDLDRKDSNWFQKPSREHAGKTVADDMVDKFRGDAWKLLSDAIDEIGVKSFVDTFGKDELEKITNDGITYLEQHTSEYGEEAAGQAFKKLDQIRTEAGLPSREFNPVLEQDLEAVS